MAVRLLIASEWKTGFEMAVVQQETTHSLDGDDEQKWLLQNTSTKMKGKKIMRYFVTFYFQVKQSTFLLHTPKKDK